MKNLLRTATPVMCRVSFPTLSFFASEYAVGASAPFGFDVAIKILFPIVVGKLFSCFDCATSNNEYFAFGAIGFAVWLAGVVDIACNVRFYISVNCFPFSYLKQIFTLVAVCLGFAYWPASILNNTGASVYSIKGIEAKTSVRSPYFECVGTSYKVLRHKIVMRATPR